MHTIENIEKTEIKTLAKRLTIAVLLFSVSALAQMPSSIQSTRVPDEVIYEEFFYRVIWLSDLTSRITAQGRDSGSVASTIQREAGLEGQEYQRVASIVSTWKSKDAAIAVSAFDRKSSSSTEMRAVQSLRRQAVRDHIELIKAAIGMSAFGRLDRYVRSTSNVKAWEVRKPGDRME